MGLNFQEILVIAYQFKKNQIFYLYSLVSFQIVGDDLQCTKNEYSFVI